MCEVAGSPRWQVGNPINVLFNSYHKMEDVALRNYLYAGEQCSPLQSADNRRGDQ